MADSSPDVLLLKAEQPVSAQLSPNFMLLGDFFSDGVAATAIGWILILSLRLPLPLRPLRLLRSFSSGFRSGSLLLLWDSNRHCRTDSLTMRGKLDIVIRMISDRSCKFSSVGRAMNLPSYWSWVRTLARANTFATIANACVCRRGLT